MPIGVGAPCRLTSVADWNAASYLSGTLQAIRDVFGKAQQAAPSILFIDELDGISDRSKIKGEYVEYWTQIVNLLLECLAGVERRPGVVVVAATNFPENIDAAILRAGRLDCESAQGLDADRRDKLLKSQWRMGSPCGAVSQRAAILPELVT